VASSDLSHFPAHAQARKSDKAALDAVLTLDAARVEATCRALEGEGTPGLDTAMCGRGPVQAVMLAATELGAENGVLLGSANSGDVEPATRNRVVGYGAVALVGPETTEERPMDRSQAAKDESGLDDAQRQRLLRIARETVEQHVRKGKAPASQETDPALTREAGAFVTLWKNGELRGCIGMIEARAPLHVTVREMAVAAASQDHRFPPVTAAELDAIRIEISVLTPPRQVKDASEIEVGKHGVIVRQGRRSGVFLPEVPVRQKWSREEMLDNLCVYKAGLARDAWKKGAELYVFTADVFEEPGPEHDES
jgi:AmmeMemoRadiSam system protein A